MRKLLFLAPLLALTGCAGMVPAMTGAPPAPVQNAAQIARAPIDLALHLFDGALYAFDLAMDLKRPAAGSPEAKRIAALGRRVLAALSVADAAQKAGSASTYDEAFRNASAAYADFSRLLGVPSGDEVAGLVGGRSLASRIDVSAPRFQLAERASILSRAVGNI